MANESLSVSVGSVSVVRLVISIASALQALFNSFLAVT